MHNVRKLNPLVEELLSNRNTLLNEDGAEMRARRSEEARLKKAGVLSPQEKLVDPGKEAAIAYKKYFEQARRIGLDKLMDFSDWSGYTEFAPYTPGSIAASEYFGAGVEELGRAETEMKEKFPGKYKELRDTLAQNLVKERKAAFDAGDKTISDKDLLIRVLAQNKDLADVLTRDEYETVAGGITSPLKIETEDEEGKKTTQIDLPRWSGMGRGAANVYDLGAGAADILTDPVQIGLAYATGGAYNAATRAAEGVGGRVVAAAASRAPTTVKTSAEATKKFLPPILARARSAEELGKAVGRATVATAGGAMVVGSGIEAASQDKLARWTGEMLGSAYPFVGGSKLVDKLITTYKKSKITPKSSEKPEFSPKPEPPQEVEVPSEVKFEAPPAGVFTAKEMPPIDFGAPAKPPVEVSPRPEWANRGEMLKAFGYRPEIFKATKGRQGGAFTTQIPEPLKTEVSKPLEPIEISRETVKPPFYEPAKPGSERVADGLKPNVPIIFWRPQEAIAAEGRAAGKKRRRRDELEVSSKPEEVSTVVPEVAKPPEVKIDFAETKPTGIESLSPEQLSQWKTKTRGEILRSLGMLKFGLREPLTATIPEVSPKPQIKTTLSLSDIKALENVAKPPESILTRAAREAAAKPKDISVAKVEPEISPKPKELTPEQVKELLGTLAPVSFQFPKPAAKPSLGRVAAAAAALPGVGNMTLPSRVSLADLVAKSAVAEVKPAMDINVPKWAATPKEPVQIINGEQIARAVADMTPQMKAPPKAKVGEVKVAETPKAPETLPEPSTRQAAKTQSAEGINIKPASTIKATERPGPVSAPTVSVPKTEPSIQTTEKDRAAPEMVGGGEIPSDQKKIETPATIEIQEPSELESKKRPETKAQPKVIQQPKTIFDMMRDINNEFQKNIDKLEQNSKEPTKENAPASTEAKEVIPQIPPVVPAPATTVRQTDSKKPTTPPPQEKGRIGKPKEKGKPGKPGAPVLPLGGEYEGEIPGQPRGFRLGADVNLGARALGRFTQFLHI